MWMIFFAFAGVVCGMAAVMGFAHA